MPDNQVYGITGQAFAGKTSLSYGFEPLNYEVIEIGERVKAHIDENYGSDVDYGRVIEEEIPNSTITGWIKSEVDEALSQDKNVVASGIRSVEMERALRQNYDAEVISVEADFDVRYNRMLERDGGDEDDFTGEPLDERDEREDRIGMKYVRSGADYHIKNEGTLEDLMGEILKIEDSWQYIQSAENPWLVENMAARAREVGK